MFLYLLINKGDVNLFLGFFGCGSEKVSHISSISSWLKNFSIKSIFVLKNLTFVMSSSIADFAPLHNLAPLISILTKFLAKNCLANSTVYSPLPQPSSRIIGLSLLNF